MTVIIWWQKGYNLTFIHGVGDAKNVVHGFIQTIQKGCQIDAGIHPGVNQQIKIKNISGLSCASANQGSYFLLIGGMRTVMVCQDWG